MSVKSINAYGAEASTAPIKNVIISRRDVTPLKRYTSNKN